MGENMTSVQYVTDESGTPVAVQISIQDWKLIKADSMKGSGLAM